MKRIYLFCFLTFFALINGHVYAGPYKQIAYNAAKNMAESAWKDIGTSCDRTDRFVQIVGDRIDETVASIGTKFRGAAAEEFAQGYIDGLSDVTEKIVNQCTDECGLLGNFMGEAAAQLMCAVANEINRCPTSPSGLNINNMICGSAYKAHCESTADSVSLSTCPKWKDCTMNYTRAVQGGACAYNPDNRN
jgi:hypothetical protein